MSESAGNVGDPALAAPVFNIAAVSRRSGVAVDTIRIWERRYQAVVPDRDEAGRRLYSDADVNRLRLLRLAVESGLRIGSIAALEDPALQDLLGEPLLDRNGAAPQGKMQGGAVVLEEDVERILSAALRFDVTSVEGELRAAEHNYGLLQALHGLYVPLLQRVGRAWQGGELRVAHEHLIAHAVRSALGEVLFRQNEQCTGPTLLCGCAEGQWHDLGALIAALAATQVGWRALFLGASVPASELAFAARGASVSCVAVSIVVPMQAQQLSSYLRTLCDGLPTSTRVLIGGQGVPDAIAADVDNQVMSIEPSLFGLMELLKDIRAGHSLST